MLGLLGVRDGLFDGLGAREVHWSISIPVTAAYPGLSKPKMLLEVEGRSAVPERKGSGDALRASRSCSEQVHFINIAARQIAAESGPKQQHPDVAGDTARHAQ